LKAATPHTLGSLLFLAAALSVGAQTLRYEAEDGVLSGTIVDNRIPGYSGAGYVTAFDDPDDFLEIPVNVPTEGFYTLSVGYAANAPKLNPIFVNGSMQGEGLFPRTQGFAKMRFGRVALHKGANTVRIGSDWGQIDVDYIELEPAPPPLPFQLSDRPVTPGASPEAQQLLATLTGLFGKKILTGQQDEHGERLAYIANITGGKAPAILGLDLLNSSGSYNRPDGQIERARDWALQRHGIVTFSWHWFSPFGATGEVWKSFSTDKTTFDASRVADETSPEYAAIVRDIDLVAGRLKVLRDAHVPVLWRPLHEAEGKWFWWGARGPETTRRIYRLMFDRFTRVHGLNNLIWVWTTTDNPGAREWYPGDAFVDIIGADIYSPAGTRGTFLSVFDNLRQLYGGRKMIALAETGALPDPCELGREGADWSWFLVWDDFISRAEVNPASVLSHTYGESRALTLDGLVSGGESGTFRTNKVMKNP